MDEKKADEMARRLLQNKFDLNDMLDQFQQIKKMGPLKQVMSMLPGVGRQLRDVEIDDRQLTRVEAIITSMTAAERMKPEIINPSRKKRIAAGSGMQVEDVNRLLRQYEQMRKMMKQFSGPGKKRKRRNMPPLPPGMGGPGMGGGFGF